MIITPTEAIQVQQVSACENPKIEQKSTTIAKTITLWERIIRIWYAVLAFFGLSSHSLRKDLKGRVRVVEAENQELREKIKELSAKVVTLSEKKEMRDEEVMVHQLPIAKSIPTR
jgi:hypothetical protein